MRIGMLRLSVTFVVAVAGWLLVQEFGLVREDHPLRDNMLAAARNTERAFAVVDSVKRARGIPFPSDSPVPWRALLGEDYTAMTTTLGSRVAKEVSSNPAWASLLVRLLDQAGVRAGDKVGVMASGSFPALALASLAALSALDAEPLLMSSLGSSSYGANVQEATLLDLESWVRDEGVLDFKSELVSAGGEDDRGAGLSAEGIAWLEEAAVRNGVALARFESLDESIAHRWGILTRGPLTAVVNIGGGQAVLGRCPHAATLPVGVWRRVPDCGCPERGVLTRIAAHGVPVIHLLNIRGLAALNGLDFEPGSRYIDNGNITTVARPDGVWIVAVLAAILVSLTVPRKMHS